MGRMPWYTDGYMSERLTDNLAKAIAARPGWSVVVFPVIPLGSGGANEWGQDSLSGDLQRAP